jgi:hypothetical protein
MSNQILNLFVVLIMTLFYLIASIKFLTSFFYRICKPMTNATLLLFCSVLFGFGLTLYQFSDIASNAMYFYASKGSIFNGVLYWTLFSLFAFGFSMGVFYFSFYLIGLLTQENEKAELSKNNFYIAGLHSIVFLVLCLMISRPIVDLANTLVNYPKFPD